MQKLAWILMGCCALGQEVRLEQFNVRVPAPGAGGEQGNVMFMRSGGPGMVEFMGHEMAINARTVKGAPYSAQGVSETNQTLADGTKITRTSKSAYYRDSEGRTRREQTLPAIGPWASTETRTMVFLDDPVAGTHYILNPQDKTARKAMISKLAPGTAPAPVGAGIVMSAPVAVGVAGLSTAGAPPPIPGPGMVTQDVIIHRRVEAGTVAEPGPVKNPDVKSESLGSKNIEGVAADGSRQTFTIPVGQIGNDRPMEIVSETWFSPELKTVVLSTQKDPRMGETTYRLTQISRAEPSKSLFEVPSDYKVLE